MCRSKCFYSAKCRIEKLFTRNGFHRAAVVLVEKRYLWEVSAANLDEGVGFDSLAVERNSKSVVVHMRNFFSLSYRFPSKVNLVELWSVLQRLENVRYFDSVAVVKVGNSAGNLDGAQVGAGRELECFGI